MRSAKVSDFYIIIVGAEESTLRSIYTPQKLLQSTEEGISRRKREDKGHKKLLNKGSKKVKRAPFQKRTGELV